jgi:hypothetical protein
VACQVARDSLQECITLTGRERPGGPRAWQRFFTLDRRASIIALASGHKVLAVCRDAVNFKDGGLLSYGPDVGHIICRAAPYLDRILRGT